jgi:hypothetical protein
MSERPNMSRREFLKKSALFGAGVATGGVAGEVLRNAADREETEDASGAVERKPDSKKEKKLYDPIEKHEFFDENPDYLKTMTEKKGEWSDEQRKERTVVLKNGEKIFHDVGMDFYRVKKGDTISGIRQKLAKYPEYAHVADQRYKLDSFNIPAKKLRADMWIPIPLETKDRELTDAQFVAYANTAIEEMKEHDEYGEEVKKILKKVSQRELVATMVAVAKQEGGGLPIGQFALHRYEYHQSAFSYSHFHVLMKGGGLRARRGLNLTEGQTYHPMNGVKLFLAFMIEKYKPMKKHADRLFPVPDHEEAFAVFYNGSGWKKTNPNYLRNFSAYYTEAEERLSRDGTRWKKDEVPQVQ